MSSDRVRDSQNLTLRLSPPYMDTFKLRMRSCKIFGHEGHAHCFYPPHAPEEWPKRVGDIGDRYVRRLLTCEGCGMRAKGLLFDGKVYTNDIPFWLSLTKDTRPQVVYEKPSWSEWRLWIDDILEGNNVYMGDYPVADLDPQTILEFDLGAWERIIRDPRWRWHFFPRRPMPDPSAALYPDEYVDPPPPYVANQAEAEPRQEAQLT